MGKNRALWPLAAILLAALLVRLPVIDQPFHRNPEGVGSYYAVMGRNYLRYGILATRGLPVQGVGQSHVDPLRVYPNHPPLIPLTVAGSYALFGVGEWQTRLPFVLFTLGGTALIYGMVWRAQRAGERTTLLPSLAAMLFAFIPLTLRYGGQPDVINAQLIFFVLLSVLAYQRFADQPNLRRLTVLGLAFIPAALTDWPAFYLVPVLVAQFLLTQPRRQWKWIAAFAVLAGMIFALLYVYIAWTTEDWRLILDQFLRRSIGGEDDQHRPFSWGSWLIDASRHGLWGISVVVAVLTGIWVLMVGVDWRRCSRLITMTRLLLAFALLHVLVGRQGVLVHDWWWWPVVPGICIAAALGIERLIAWITPDHKPIARGLRVVTIVGVAGLCAWHGWRMLRWFGDPQTIYGGNPSYTVVELGQAIQAAAAPDHCVMLVDHDPLPYVWYYGDRPIMMDVWDLETFEARRRSGLADLPFGYAQPWTPPPAGIVIPRVYLPHVAPLAAYLEQTYARIELPEELAEKFIVYSLSSSQPQVTSDH